MKTAFWLIALLAGALIDTLVILFLLDYLEMIHVN